jgi:hypothetical protein
LPGAVKFKQDLGGGFGHIEARFIRQITLPEKEPAD